MAAPETVLSEEQFQAQYGLEPAMLQNLKASQKQLKAMGRDLTLEEVYALEIDQADVKE
jgi:hypothetical protein